jgi:hypothetical protein
MLHRRLGFPTAIAVAGIGRRLSGQAPGTAEIGNLAGQSP